MKQKTIVGAALLSLLTACSTTQEKVEQEVSYINEYPTRDRVDYVLQCIAKHGGLTYINQYACGCKIDKIAEKMSFADYEAAMTFGYMRKTAGESGSAFRDPKESKRLKKLMQEAEEYAEKMCFVK
ncbi:hypothetical protein [Methylomarinum vadi]|uniref:hypothetical protein n=1 Tax=Methylomarinum vadi TaxID=438855 RepID=UPI0004DF8053|nr:hypothetical protein [Methylomarinum vadi]